MKEDNNEKFKVLQDILVSQMDMRQDKMEVLIADMKNSQKKRGWPAKKRWRSIKRR
jgi:hypothetical protein